MKKIVKASESDTRKAAADKAVAECDVLSDKLSDMENALLTASKIQLPSQYLSPTQIDSYLRCPQQYKRSYIDKIKSPPGIALVEGSSHHAALEQNNLHKIKNGKDLEAKKVISILCDTFSTKKKEIEDWEGEDEASVIKRGAAIVNTYMRDFAPTLHPEKAERTICVPVGPVRILGVMDVEGFILPAGRKTAPGKNDKKTIVDYKTVSRARSQSDADDSLQLSYYGYAKLIGDGEKVGAGLCSLVKSSGLVKWVPTEITQARINWFRYIALSVANSISLGNFPVTSPDQWCCSPRFCGYYANCRGKVESSKKVTVLIGGKPARGLK